MKNRTLMIASLVGLASIPVAPAVAEPVSPAAQAVAFGKCVVEADRSAAITLFQRTPADSSMIDPRTAQTGGAVACGNNAAPMPAMQMRGAIAEALYYRDFREAGMQPRRAAGDFATLNLPEGAADPDGVFAVSRCVARARFTVVDKLFAMPAGSRREHDFIVDLMPYFSACQPKGTQVSIRLGEIRALMAQSAYEGNVKYWANQTAAAR